MSCHVSKGWYWGVVFINKEGTTTACRICKLWAAADRPKAWGIIKFLSKQRAPGHCCCGTVLNRDTLSGEWLPLLSQPITSLARRGMSVLGSPPSHTHAHQSVHSTVFQPVFMECLLTPANSTLRTFAIFSRTSSLHSCINMLPQHPPPPPPAATLQEKKYFTITHNRRDA